MADYVAKEFFVYTASLSSLAAGVSQAAQVNIEADSDFMINKIMGYVVTGSAAGTVLADPNLTVQLTDSASGRNMFNEAVPFSLISGNGQLPFVPPVAKLLRAKSTLTVTFANRTGATMYNIALSFAGTKLYLA